eukprot:12901950-Alexandrium_andersonii.AAC.1
MAEVQELLGDGGVEVQQLLGDRADLGLQGLCRGRLLGLRAPELLELVGAGGEERLHGGPGFADRLALGLKFCSGLANQARGRLIGIVGERPLGGLCPDQPACEDRLALKQGVHCSSDIGQEPCNPLPLLLSPSPGVVGGAKEQGGLFREG